MSVNPVWRTGDESAAVPIGVDGELRCVLRQHCVDFENHVGQRLVQCFQVERIPFFQAIQIREHFLSREAGMPGQNTMGTDPAYGQ